MLVPVALHRSSPIPLRRQLARQLEERILAGKIERGCRLPSVRALAGRLAVHRNTVAAAYRELDRRGLVRAAHGSGVYVGPVDRFLAAAPDAIEPALAGLVRAARAGMEPWHHTLARLAAWSDGIVHGRLALLVHDPELASVVRHELAERLPVISVEASPPSVETSCSSSLRSLPIIPVHPGLPEPTEAREPGIPLRLGIDSTLLLEACRPRPRKAVGIISDSAFVRALARESLEVRLADRVGVVAASRDDSAALRKLGRIADVVAIDAVGALATELPAHVATARLHVISRASLDELRALLSGGRHQSARSRNEQGRTGSKSLDQGGETTYTRSPRSGTSPWPVV